MRVVQSIPAPDDVADAVSRAFALPPLFSCRLLRRGFSPLFEIELADGGWVVARISPASAAGAQNARYEAALLKHLRGLGAPVSASLLTRSGDAAAQIRLPEGGCLLMLFEHWRAEALGDNLDDVEAAGRGVAMLHDASASYAGPTSEMTLDLASLVDRPLAVLASVPMMNEPLRAAFASAAGSMKAKIPERLLEHCACHGSLYADNIRLVESGWGTVPRFTHFDAAAPGWVAYDLCAYLWSLLSRQTARPLNGEALVRWQRYLRGYRSVRQLAQADLEAIAAFVPVRQLWLMGQYAEHLHLVGTESMPTRWLYSQVDLFHAWAALETPT